MPASTLHARKQICILHDTNACIHLACMKQICTMHDTNVCIHLACMKTNLHHAWYKCMHPPCMHETDLHHAWYKCMYPPCVHENKFASCMIQMSASTLHAWKQICIRYDTNACIHLACKKTDLHFAWYKCMHPPCMHENKFASCMIQMSASTLHAWKQICIRYDTNACIHIACKKTDLHFAWYKCMHPPCVHENRFASCMIQMSASTLHARKQICILHDTNACIHLACMKTDLHHAWYKCPHLPCMHENRLASCVIQMHASTLHAWNQICTMHDTNARIYLACMKTD